MFLLQESGICSEPSEVECNLFTKIVFNQVDGLIFIPNPIA